MVRDTSRRTQAGTTLMEVLTVIGILAVLAGLVFAVMAPARERARRLTCVSNLHQIHTALMLYAHDYGGVEPGGRLVLSYSDLGLPPTEPRFGDVDFLPMYLPDRNVWRCADDPHPNPPYPRSYTFWFLDDTKLPVNDPNGLTVGERSVICGERTPLFEDPYHGWREDSTFVLILRWSGQIDQVFQHFPPRVCAD